MNIQQMLMAMMMGKMNPMQNPAIRELMQMRQQGIDPNQALQQIAQRYPQFQQLQGQTPQQMDAAARATIQKAGMNPNQVLGQLKRYF